MYLTGDFGRWNETDEIEITGRLDDMVKINGYRIELDEISANLKHVEKAIVLKIEEELVAFVTPVTANVDQILLSAAQTLPHYMLPTIIVPLAAFPLTGNGKIDKKSLRQIDLNTYICKDGKYDDMSDIEKEIASIVAEVLKIDVYQISRDSDFFRLGGDSITAIGLANLASSQGMSITSRDVFMNRKIGLIATASQKQNEVLKPMKEMKFPSHVIDEIEEFLKLSREEFDAYPCTPLQSEMFAETMSNPSAFVYQMTWKLNEQVTLNRLRMAWIQVIEKHDILRTCFVPTSNGMFQAVLPFKPENVPLIKSSKDLNTSLSDGLKAGFTKESRSWVGMTVVSDPVSQTDQYFILKLHHIIYDGWSLAILRDDFRKAYSNQLDSDIVQFKPFVQHINSQSSTDIKRFWVDYLKGVEFDPLFKTISQGNTYGVVESILPITRKELKNSAQRLGTTEAAICKLAWAFTLKTLYQSEDVVFGEVVSGRDVNLDKIQRLTGPTISTVPFRLQMSGKTIGQLVSDMGNEKQFTRLQYATVGITEIQNWTKINPIIESIFKYQNYVASDKSNTELQLVETKSSSWNTVIFPLEVIVTPSETDISMNIEYRKDKIDLQTMLRIQKVYQKHIETILKDDSFGLIVEKDSLLSTEEISRLLKYGKGPAISLEFKCAHYAFEHYAKCYPELIAIEKGSQKMTYQELNEKSNMIASNLSERGVNVGDFVGLLAVRSIEMICGLIGILKVGAGYIPLDAALPNDRINYILDVVGCNNILYHAEVPEDTLNSMSDKQLISLEAAIDNSQQNYKITEIPPNSTAFVVFTSGSTGKPKGVNVSHQCITNYSLTNLPAMVPNLNQKRWASVFSVGFDMFSGEIISVLSNGGILCLPHQDIFEMVKTVDYLYSTPTFLSMLDPSNYENLKTILTAGEPMPPSLANVWFRKTVLINSYGPCETTVVSSFSKVESQSYTIGRPLPNTVQYILDKNMNLVPLGVAGELVIGGLGVTLGYINQPNLTSVKFITDHFANDGTKMYRTGDICRWTEDGELQILGREDDMVKVKGYRIELNEVSLAVEK
ncbi:hypothetical protein BC833DRAFT_544737, partial [Globomyces pollinis-pini]